MILLHDAREIGYVCSYQAYNKIHGTYVHVPGIVFVPNGENAHATAEALGAQRLYSLFPLEDWDGHSSVVQSEPSLIRTDPQGFAYLVVHSLKMEFPN